MLLKYALVSRTLIVSVAEYGFFVMAGRIHVLLPSLF